MSLSGGDEKGNSGKTALRRRPIHIGGSTGLVTHKENHDQHEYEDQGHEERKVPSGSTALRNRIAV
ncbi:MAG TPA: hypothetical protein VHN74_19950 [Candidatus Angelobacter sp.]|nr:hypothetical protein [Candidatus Angelobacter sp.]